MLVDVTTHLGVVALVGTIFPFNLLDKLDDVVSSRMARSQFPVRRVQVLKIKHTCCDFFTCQYAVVLSDILYKGKDPSTYRGSISAIVNGDAMIIGVGRFAKGTSAITVPAGEVSSSLARSGARLSRLAKLFIMSCIV
jgi:hypothetical protein